MKILFGTSLFEPNLVGGAERVVQLLAQRLESLGHEVAVITTQPAGRAQVDNLRGVTVHYVPVRNLYRPFTGRNPGTAQKFLWRAIDSYNVLMNDAIGRVLDLEKPDVLNTHSLTGLSAALWAQAVRRRVPIVHTLHDQYLLCHRGTMFRPPKNCRRRCIDCKIVTAPRKRLSRHVDAVIGVSNFIVTRHREHGYFRSQRATVIYNTAFRRPPELLERRPGASSAFHFGFLGQIIPTKGVRQLIRAFQGTPPGVAELWIAGKCDSQYAYELQNETRGDTRIRWLGYVDPEEFFAGIEVLVVPSLWHDTAPLVVNEAFGHGVPVIGAARGGIPELIPAECGWLFDPGASPSLLSTLMECIRAVDRLPAMRQACYERAVRASRAPWAERYLATFREVIEQAAGQLRTGTEKL